MDFQNLETAAAYINNLLLARGLLRNGKSIEFAHPASASGGSEATMARVINLVHDLILRRDREAEQREALATTIRNLRAAESKQILEIERLTTKNAELSRSVSIAEGQERTFKSTLRSAETAQRSLKEQMLRMKQTLQQVRTQCANDVRKRDVELQRLKTHVSGVQRGKREGGLTTITITPTLPPAAVATRSGNSGDAVDIAGYSLNEETNEFLTKLCQNLSDENDALIGLLRSTIATLKDLQGLETVLGSEDAASGEMETQGLSILEEEPSEEDDAPMSPLSFEVMNQDMQHVLENLRNILTNPSFAPIEEVEIREEELIRLRAGWEKMEGRWKDAVTMMDGWRKRVLDGGDAVKVEEIKMGMGLGMSVAARASSVGESSQLTNNSSIFDEDIDEVDESDGLAEDGISIKGEEDESVEPAQASKSEQAVAPTGTLSSASQPVLSATSGNRRPIISPRKVSFQSPLNNQSPDSTTSSLQASSTSSTLSASHTSSARNTVSTKQAVSRSHGSRMTVNEKLAAAEAAAKTADQRRRKREREQAAPTASHTEKSSSSTVRKQKGEEKSRSKRRRSTLSQEELLDLIGVTY